MFIYSNKKIKLIMQSDSLLKNRDSMLNNSKISIKVFFYFLHERIHIFLFVYSFFFIHSKNSFFFNFYQNRSLKKAKILFCLQIENDFF